jgi:hypothetical protein
MALGWVLTAWVLGLYLRIRSRLGLLLHDSAAT